MEIKFQNYNSISMSSNCFSVRVGRVVGNKNPSFPGFKNIVCLTPSTPYGSIGPYVLKDEDGRIMENIYQASKVYIKTPKVKEVYSRWDHRIIWERKAEVHIIPEDEVPKDGKLSGCYVHISNPIKGIKGRAYLTPDYFKWRIDLMTAKDPIRYPVGMKCRKDCVGALSDDELVEFTRGNKGEVTLLDYIEARKMVYIPVYQDLVLKSMKIGGKDSGKFKKLIDLSRKNNILIIEVDGPHQESLGWYEEKYGVSSSFIENNTMLATPEYLDIMLNDSKHPYGHGYALADLVMKVNSGLIKI